MAGDKKITELTELTALDSVSWFEVVDLNETDPALQNKKIKSSNMNPDAHIQNTDQLLDEGGANEITASTLNIASNRALVYGWVNSDSTPPTTSGFMEIEDVSAGVANLKLNDAPIGVGDIQSVIDTVRTGALVQVTFNNGGGSILLRTSDYFSIVSGYWEAKCSIMYDDRNAGADGAFSIVTFMPFNMKPQTPFEYETDSTGTATGKFNYDDTPIAITMSKTNRFGQDVSAMITGLPIGTFIHIATKSGAVLVTTIATFVDQGTYLTVNVSEGTSTGTVFNNEDVTLTIL